MLERHASLFVEGVSALSETKWICVQTDKADMDSEFARKQIFAMGSYGLDKVKQASILSDNDAILPELNRVEQALEGMLGSRVYRLDTVAQALKHLISRVQDDLRSTYFFHVSPQDVPLYVAAEPFGDRVSRKFPKTIEDIAEASKCLALQRPTACVFHLMRAMEMGVQTLGRKLKVSINVEIESWYHVMLHVDGAIKTLPAKTAKEKRRKAQLGLASANLNAVRIAQRNDVMHPKQTYTKEEAHAVFEATRMFMTQLAEWV